MSKIIRVACYKNSKSLFGNLIRWKQKKKFSDRYSKYTHTELVFEDGWSFSSSEQDKGVRMKQIDFKAENWDFIDIEVSEKKYNTVLKFCRKEVGNGYNWTSIFFSQMLNMNIKGKKDWFCSEICCTALQQIKMLCGVSALFVEPAELAYRLEKGEYILED